MEDRERGGYLVPPDIDYEITTSDFKPSLPKWWQFWKVSKYNRDLKEWTNRFNTYWRDHKYG